MERDSQELRTYSRSRSWPPGFFVGSVPDSAARARRRRDGLRLVGLAVCAWCVGFALTDRFCASNEKASLAHVHAVALDRERRAALAGARAQEPAAEVIALDNKVDVVDDERAPAAIEPTRENKVRRVHKRASPPTVLGDAEPVPTEVVQEEPSPVVTEAEVKKTLALAAASRRIFASVDEASPKPIAVLPPPAAVLHEAAPSEANLVAIEALRVEGGLPTKVVTRGVQRLLPQYDRCREMGDSAPQRLKLSTTIDEAGHGRSVTVEGPSQPDVRHCLEQATSRLVVPAPDTGTAHARWIVRFAAR